MQSRAWIARGTGLNVADPRVNSDRNLDSNLTAEQRGVEMQFICRGKIGGSELAIREVINGDQDVRSVELSTGRLAI